MKNMKRISGRIAVTTFMCISFIVINAYSSGQSLAQSLQENDTPTAPTPVSTNGEPDAVLFYPGDLRKDNADTLARTRFDPICNAMITTSGDFEYGFYNVVGGILITKYTGSSSVVRIPEMIDGMPVRGIGVGLGRDIQAEYYETDELYADYYDNPFGVFNKPDRSLYGQGGYSPFMSSNIVEVYIPDTVISIGDLAFADCSELANISLPDSVRYIGWGAFRNCTKLISMAIPNSVIEIGGYAFEGCTGLTNVTLPESMQHIWYGAFKDCSSLKSVTIPDGITTIESSTFNGCKGLTSITIPDSVTRVAYDRDGRGVWGAFEGIPNFSAVYQGENYTSSNELYDAINGQ